MNQYYQVLGLTGGATQDEIRQAYRKLAKLYHPDVNKSPDAHQKFCEISEAYEFLMNYWPKQAAKFETQQSYEQKYREHQHSAAYEQFRREAQERARKQARMRYEKFRKQHEAFMESGLNDLALLFTMFMRGFSLLLFLFLFLSPVIFAVGIHWSWIFTIFMMWPFAAGLAWYYHDNRKNYFMPGKFYYSADRIWKMFTETHYTDLKCFYSRDRMADSKPYRLEMHKLKDIKLATGGFRQHVVNYINKDIAVMIPRSQKAFIVQSLTMIIKLFSIVACILFLDISSLVWRLILGFVCGGILSRIMLLASGTRSNVSYLFNYSLVIRLIIWIITISLATKFYVSPFDAISTEGIYFAVFAVVIFDSLIMQLISMVLGKYASYPLIRQHPEVEQRIREGYILYNDIPVLSFFYPIFKWLLG